MKDIEGLKTKIEEYIPSGIAYALSVIKLNTPVANPSKIVAVSINYLLHRNEMNEQFQTSPPTVYKIGFFLKSPSSIIGPGEKVQLPFRDSRTDHEAEIAFVEGKRVMDVYRTRKRRLAMAEVL